MESKPVAEVILIFYTEYGYHTYNLDQHILEPFSTIHLN